MKFLALYLRASLQSWGAASKFGDRGTLDAPTRSGLLGMIVAACGIDKNDEERLKGKYESMENKFENSNRNKNHLSSTTKCETCNNKNSTDNFVNMTIAGKFNFELLVECFITLSTSNEQTGCKRND